MTPHTSRINAELTHKDEVLAQIVSDADRLEFEQAKEEGAEVRLVRTIHT